MSRKKVTRRIGLAPSVMNQLKTNMYGVVDTYARGKNIRIFKLPVAPVLLYGGKTCTLIPTGRGMLMSLVPGAFAGSWGVAGTDSSLTRDYPEKKLGRGCYHLSL